MEITPQQQIFEQIRKSKKILIALPQNLTPDSLSSGLALKLFLTKQEKDVLLVSSGKLPGALGFLPGSNQVLTEIPGGKSLVISVDTTQKKLGEVSYQTEAGKVSIYLKSENDEFTQEDLSFASEKFPLDLVIVLEAHSLEDLGSLYERYTDLFFETPKINLDNKASNEYFGAINLVDVTATSIAEILTGLLQEYEAQLLDEDIATCLLAGIITKTQSFQHVLTTPRAFLKASEMVALGGRQQEIIKSIYKTKPLSLLKLWGRALARMKINEGTKAVHSILTQVDFEKAESSAEDLLPALMEFLENLSGYKVVALIAEAQKGQVQLLAAVHQQLPEEKFLEALGQGAKILGTSLGNYKLVELVSSGISLENVEENFLSAVKTIPASN